MFIFCVVGPLLRTGTQLMVLACPMPLRYRWFFHEFSRYMSIFFAYEVRLQPSQLSCGPSSASPMTSHDPHDLP